MNIIYAGDLPTVDDDVHTGVENQQEVGEVGQYVTPILICTHFFDFFIYFRIFKTFLRI